MMIGHCEDCRWWAPYQDRLDLGSCRLLSSDSENAYSVTSTMAHVSGESFHGATLFTAPDFGCVQHEAKP